MVSMLALSVLDRWFEPWSGQTKDYKIGIYCFTVEHTAFMEKEQRLFGSESG